MKTQQQGDRATWSAPEDVTVSSIVVEHGRLPIEEPAVRATISAGDVSVLPPIDLWRKQPDDNSILVAGLNRLEAHKRCGCEVITARTISGETLEIVRAVQLIEIDENLTGKRRADQCGRRKGVCTNTMGSAPGASAPSAAPGSPKVTHAC